MRVGDIAAVIEKMVPLELAQEWDNVGLLIGDPQSRVRNILLTIDVTKEVLAEAKKQKSDLIISYHPVIWDGLKKITVADGTEIVYELIRSGMAVFSIHTALDAAIGGVNDALAEIVGIADGKPIGDYVESPGRCDYKLVVFVPVESVQKVSEAVFAAGAGVIGNYRQCSFRAEGTGTFLPQEKAKPAIGRKGRLENVQEIRLETVVPAEKLDSVIAAMKETHTYETPAFDVFKLYHRQEKSGLGRIGKLAKPLRVEQIVQGIKKHTGAKTVGIVGDDKRLVEMAAVCAGSCGKIINSVIAAKAELYVTGELKHHHALAAQQAGLTCICLSHSVSERFILKKLARQLQEQIKQVTIKISKKDVDPFIWKNI